jgi:glycine cleavage system protein P-like pyridoxal-binding family
MLELTNSEILRELERFIAAMNAAREKIWRVESGEWLLDSYTLKHAPHSATSTMPSRAVSCLFQRDGRFSVSEAEAGKVLGASRRDWQRV